MICPRCQQSVRDGARFCDSCGLSIGSIASANQSAESLADTVKAVDPLIGHVIDSKYLLIEQIGKGGMGVVYRAERVLVGDEVALKILRGEFVAEEETVERFRREARAAAKLRHPNIVTIYDYGEARGADAPAYIVMELLDGESLRDLLRRKGRLQPERAIQLMRGICAGIGLAHRREIVHRDIKPDNIILLPPDEEAGREHETVKVVDFGIAKLRDAATGGTLTRKGFQPGTIYYMSPEQCRGDALDARSDVYSLGALLYEMLAGVPPFVAESQTGVISKHLFDPPPPLPKEGNIAPSIEAVVMRALAKEMDARPADAGALASELKEAEQRDREFRQRGEEAERLRAESERRQTEEAARQREDEARRETAERQREEERVRQGQAAQAASLEELRGAEEQRIRASQPLPDPTERAPRRETGPKRQLETDAARTHRALVKPALVDHSNFGATDADAASSLGVDYAGDKRKRGGSKVWIVLGVLIVTALVVWLSVKLFGSNSSLDTTKNTTDSSSPTSAPNAAVPNFKPVGNVLKTERDVFKVALSPDGKTLISTGVTSMSPTGPITNHFDISGSSLAFSPDGKLLAVGQDDGSIIIKDPKDLSHKLELYDDKDYVFIVGFSDDGAKFVSASGDKNVRVRFIEDGPAANQIVAQQILRAPLDASQLLVVTIDATRLRMALFSPHDKSVAIVPIAGGGESFRLDGRNGEVSCGTFSPDGKLLALGESIGTVEIWGLSDSKLLLTYDGPARGEVGSVAFTPDGQYLAIGWNNGDIELRRTSDGSTVQTLKGHTKVVRTLTFSRDGRTLASGAEDKTIRLWQN